MCRAGADMTMMVFLSFPDVRSGVLVDLVRLMAYMLVVNIRFTGIFVARIISLLATMFLSNLSAKSANSSINRQTAPFCWTHRHRLPAALPG